jgi:hypothetical protein
VKEGGAGMKKIRLSVLVIAVWMILPMTLWASEVTRDVVSDRDAKVFYYGAGGSNYPVEPTGGLPEDWNNNQDFDDSGWPAASLYQDQAYLNPPDTFPFDESEAQWISISRDGRGLDAAQIDGTRGVYLYRKIFKVSPMAYNVTGEVAIASDNYGWLYLNGIKVLDGDLNPDGYNFSAASTGAIPQMQLACENVLAAEIQNGCQNCGEHGPTAAIFALKLDYELPDVVWEPPVSNLGSSGRKNGSTLPLKFRLYGENGKLIKQPQQVYLAVHEGGFADPLGDIVEEWTLGNSVRNMRFSKGNGQYIANFQTNKMNLDDGPYTAVVHDVCSDEVLGYTEFDLVGKKKEKDPKPPKPNK